MTDDALILFRFLHFTAAMLLWGQAVLRFGQPATQDGRRLAGSLAAVNLLAALGWLAAQAAIAGEGWPDAANPAVLIPLLSHTHFGIVWTPHVLLALALPVLARRAAGAIAIAIGAGLNLGALGLIGHAVLPAGPLAGLHQALSILHLLAAGFWAGGLVVVLRSLRGAPDAELLGRFSRIGHGAVATVIVTGAAKAILIETATGRFDPARLYLVLLAAKALAVGVMVCLALLNRYRFLPRLAQGRPTAQRRMVRATAGEIVLAGLVLALTSRLATLSPFG